MQWILLKLVSQTALFFRAYEQFGILLMLVHGSRE